MRARVPAAAALVLLAATAGAQSSAPASEAAVATQVDAYLKPYVEGGNFSGTVLLARGGRVLVERSYGMANHELGVANAPKTRFHIASLSKPFTAAAILLLEAQGKLTTSDPVSKWVTGIPNGERMTLHHLLTHTSGIEDINGTPFYEAESRKAHTPESLVALIRGFTPRSAPGEGYRYSNSNYNVLAYVIERASGRAYGDFLKEAIFDPLGMSDTGHDGVAAAIIKERAAGYVPAGRSGFLNAPWFDWSVKTGNGSLYSTAADLLRFDRALHAGTLLAKNAVERILAAGSGNAYGWFVGERNGKRRLGTGGRSPGFTSALDHYLDDRVTVIVLSNSYSTASQSPIAVDLGALALGKVLPAPAKLIPVAMTDTTLEPFQGRYVGGKDFFFPGVTLDVSRREGHLIMRWSSGADSILVPVSSQGEFLDRSFWARVRFERDPFGAPTRIIWTYDGTDYPAARAPAP